MSLHNNTTRTHYNKVLELDPQNSQATAIRYWLKDHQLIGRKTHRSRKIGRQLALYLLTRKKSVQKLSIYALDFKSDKLV